MHINRLLVKLPKTCLAYLFEDSESTKMAEMHTIYVSRINSMIKSEGALQ